MKSASCSSRVVVEDCAALCCQALKVEMIDILVRFLETGLENLENPAAIKAQIVKALKSMQRSLKHGEEVRNVPHD